jgi:tellurite resistance protein TehA-like permease
MNKLQTNFAWLVKQAFHYLLHYIGSTLGVAVISALIFLVTTFLKGVKNHESFLGYLDKPNELVSPFVITVLIVIVLVTLPKALRFNRLTQFGVRAVSNHQTKAEKDGDWLLVQKDLSLAR